MPRNETRIVVRHAPSPRLTSILSPGALVFVADVVCAFRTRLSALLTRRARLERRPRRAPRRRLPESADVRSSRWTCLAVPPILADRRVEIVGPVDRASVFAALDSAADAFVADLDDATSPTWSNILDGHANLRDAAKGTLSVDVAGSRLDLRRSAPPIFLRPRGVGVHEDHVLLDGQPVPAALFDVALYAFHVARDLAARGAGPFFSLTKVDGQFEARFWRDLFSYLEGALALPRGTIKAVVRVDTPRAALEMHEMLWELREHSAGLACGRWASAAPLR